MKISIIIPIYNESKSIAKLIDGINYSMDKINDYDYEIVIINDGSNDNSNEIKLDLKNKFNNITYIPFVRNYGQTAAITAGIDYSKGEIIIPIDGDLQNDPQDIPKLIEKLEQGYDVVSGWRKNRKDNYFSTVLPSKIANWIISKISGVYLRDYGCTLKAYRKTIIQNIKLYGEMHRFIPIYIAWLGGKVAEVPVRHRIRKYGNSNYGLSKTFSVILDLILIKFMEKQFTHPIHLFGGFAIFNLGVAVILFFIMLLLKFYFIISFIQTPLPELIVMFIMISILSLFMGILAEILMRTYFESQNKKPYQVIKKNN